MKKYLYCIPFAGFNDILSQIYRSYIYSKKYDRILVINTLYSRLDDLFSKYFMTNLHNVILHPDDSLLSSFNLLAPFPPETHARFIKDSKGIDAGRLDPYLAGTSSDLQHLKINLSQAYPEDILVHRQIGNGLMGDACLRHLQFTPEVALQILQSLSALGEDYDAIHVRNTDYGSNYMPFFEELFPSVSGRKLLICSDDAECIKIAHDFFTESQVMTVTDIPDLHGKPIHIYSQNIFEKNLTLLTDLIGLARAQNLFAAKVDSKYRKKLDFPHFTGFSRLAFQLHLNPFILCGLFSALPDSAKPLNKIHQPTQNYIRSQKKAYIRYMTGSLIKDKDKKQLIKIECCSDDQRTQQASQIRTAIIPMNIVGGKKIRIGSRIMLDPGWNGIAYNFSDSFVSPWDCEMSKRGFKVYKHAIPLFPNNFFSNSIKKYHKQENLILYMDIKKDSEWNFFENLKEEDLSHFRQIVLSLGEREREREREDALANPTLFALNKLRQTHTLIHVHYHNDPQNSIVFFKKLELLSTNVIELSYVSTQDYEFEPCFDYFPTALDKPVNPQFPEIPIGCFHLLDL